MVYKNEQQNKKYTNKELFEGLFHPINLHYTGPNKTWISIREKDEYWWYYANKTDYLNEIIIFANKDKNIINEMFIALKYLHEYILNYQI